jgi:hypothetical protein
VESSAPVCEKLLLNKVFGHEQVRTVRSKRRVKDEKDYLCSLGKVGIAEAFSEKGNSTRLKLCLR